MADGAPFRPVRPRPVSVAAISSLAMALAVVTAVARQRQATPPDPAQRLAVSVAPNPVIAGSEGGVYVFAQVVDANGDPVKTAASSSSPLVITLTSSDLSILKPYAGRNVVTLDKPTCGHGEFSTDKAGVASITASAPGFAPVSASINVVAGGATPAKVRLYAVPPRVAPGCRAIFLVQMLDANGRPATPKFHTPLTLDSSSPQVVSGDKGLYFLRDFTAQQASLYVRDAAGTTTLTASGQGLTSEPATFAIVPLATPAPAAPAPSQAQQPASQASPAALEERAYRLGTEAAERAQADSTNAEKIIAERYQQAMALSADAAVQQRLTDAFRRGYRAGAPAATPPAQAPASGVARIFNVTAARSVAWGKPVGSADTFTPDTNPIHVWFQYEGLPAGTKIMSVWYYLDTVTPTKIEEAAATTEQAASSGQFSLELAPGKVWPQGAYRVDLLVDGKSLAEARFKIALAAAGAAPGQAARYTHPRAGFELVVPDGWTTNDQVSPADLQMKPAQGEGLMEITSGPVSVKLDPVSYAAGWESASVGAGKLLGRKRGGRFITVDGENAYEGVYEGEGVLAKVVFVGIASRFYVMTGVFKSDEFPRGEGVFDRMAQSFRARRTP